MSVVHSSLTAVEVGSVAFVPLQKTPSPVPRKPVDFSRLPLVHRILQQLDQPLASLARQARRAGPLDRGAVVLLAGCRRGAGCSIVSLALAGAATRQWPVLLIDGDLQNAGLSSLLNVPPRTGWEGAVAGLAASEQVLSQADPDGLVSFLPLSLPVPDPDRLLHSPVLPAWLAKLRRQFGLIVIDGGPVHETGICWASVADGACLVCDAGPEVYSTWANAWDRLEEGGVQVLGIIETFVE